MNKLNELLQARAEKIEQQRALLDAAESESRDFTPEEAQAFDALDAEIEALDAEIEKIRAHQARQEKVRNRERGLDEPMNEPFRGAFGLDTQKPKLDDGGFTNLGEFLDAVRFGDSKGRLDLLARSEGKTGGIAVPEAFRSLILPSVRNEQSMGTGSEGGYAVPPQFRQTMLALQGESSIVRSRATVIPAGDPPDAQITMPALNQGANGAYGGVSVSWISEGAAVPDTGFSLLEVSLQPNEVAASVTLTNKLLRNWSAASALTAALLQAAAQKAEDVAFLSGDGTGKPAGVLSGAGAIAVNRATANQISVDDINGMLAKLLPESQSNAVWVANQSTLPQLATLKDAVGNFIFVRGDITRGIPSTLYGMPIVFTGRTPALGNKGDLMLVDFSKYLIKDGSGPFVEASPHVQFQNNKTVIKITWNVDGKPWVTAPLTLDDGVSTASPYVVLDVPSA
ncbi:MAG: phage major capsid protein [Alicyclobacillus sp.]|nr:phage major capsid protein [Alicyclobacillus sp.]